MKRFLMLVVILGLVGLCDAQDECGPAETPWGLPCSMTAEDCRPFLRHLFVDGAVEETDVRLVVDYSSGEPDVRESRVDWRGIEGPQRFQANDIPTTPKRIRWFTKWAEEAQYAEVPILDCWCEPLTGEIERCINGQPQE